MQNDISLRGNDDAKEAEEKDNNETQENQKEVADDSTPDKGNEVAVILTHFRLYRSFGPVKVPQVANMADIKGLRVLLGVFHRKTCTSGCLLCVFTVFASF